MEEVPDNVDVIILGTGLTESVISAACARVGKSLADWSQSSESEPSSDSTLVRVDDNGPETLKWESVFETVTNLEEISYVANAAAPAPENGSDQEEWTLEKLKKLSRKFNIDLCPRVIYSRGPMVDLLVQSNICRYLEFKCVSKVLSYNTRNQDQFKQVPCSRSDIFNSKSVSIVQKRMLMKFMTFCMDLEKQASNLEEYEGMSFVELLEQKELDDELKEFLITSIVMADDTVSAKEALERLKKFTSSVGRFGDTPFLCPLYGNGELPQAFCRLSAVFGGTYCLKQPLSAIKVDDSKHVSSIVIANGKSIGCHHLVVGLAHCPRQLVQNNDDTIKISRAIFVTDKPLNNGSEKDEVTLIRIAGHEGSKCPVTLVELGHTSCVVPKGLNLVYASQLSVSDTAKRDLLPLVKCLFSSATANSSGQLESQKDRPQLLWSCYFNHVATKGKPRCTVNGVHVTNSPVDEVVDYGAAIDEAKSIFDSMFPGSEFLPRAPDAEDIVIETAEANNGNANDNLQ
ncbi:Rab proteins geranylgeranyltransferase component A [Halotydeus destructor]|nr:Rab proteins geranylgeranyltransferase component A [Halotydeus destructor]